MSKMLFDSCSIDDVEDYLCKNIEAKLLEENVEDWCSCYKSIPKGKYVPLLYKPKMIEYQAEYYKDIFLFYKDISLVLYRGGKRVGIWPLCIFEDEKGIHFGTEGTFIHPPLFCGLSKMESQRAIIEKCLISLFDLLNKYGGKKIRCCETIMDSGCSQWTRKLMEHGARVVDTRWQAFADLYLSEEEIESRIRRTNKYSVAKGREDFDIEIYDESSTNIDMAFEEFHKMHYIVSGRETRSQSTWEIQKKSIAEGNRDVGRSFFILIRDKETKELAGAALFDTTVQSGEYSVAVYDRSRFSKPVGHIIQAVAMKKMQDMGIRWYEIGERLYPGDRDVNEKLINIGHYKEGFATHLFPRIVYELERDVFYDSIKQ